MISLILVFVRVNAIEPIMLRIVAIIWVVVITLLTIVLVSVLWMSSMMHVVGEFMSISRVSQIIVITRWVCKIFILVICLILLVNLVWEVMFLMIVVDSKA